MKFLVFDRRTIEKGIVVRSKYIVVSIHDPDKRPPRIRQATGLVATLQLGFHDAEPTPGFQLPAAIRPMTSDDANKICLFVKQHWDDVGTIVCHCEQGMSRSPAVALALADAFGEEDEAERIRLDSQPNQYIYDLLRKAIQAGSESEADSAGT